MTNGAQKVGLVLFFVGLSIGIVNPAALNSMASLSSCTVSLATPVSSFNSGSAVSASGTVSTLCISNGNPVYWWVSQSGLTSKAFSGTSLMSSSGTYSFSFTAPSVSTATAYDLFVTLCSGCSPRAQVSVTVQPASSPLPTTYPTTLQFVALGSGAGVPGVQVTLTENGALIAASMTDGSGTDKFSSLQQGTYQVQFTPPQGYACQASCQTLLVVPASGTVVYTLTFVGSTYTVTSVSTSTVTTTSTTTSTTGGGPGSSGGALATPSQGVGAFLMAIGAIAMAEPAIKKRL